MTLCNGRRLSLQQIHQFFQLTTTHQFKLALQSHPLVAILQHMAIVKAMSGFIIALSLDLRS